MSKPITEKHTSTFETSFVRVGCCGMQGWRRGMEDAHVAHVNLEGKKDALLCSVFDGHNGQAIAKYCSANIVAQVLASGQAHGGDMEKAFHDAYLAIDAKLMTSELRNDGGCTAVSVLVAGGKVYCGNAGDSRAVMCRKGVAVPLSFDHKPTHPTEIARIERAGSTVSNGRVNGMLSLTRAIGDFDFKMNKDLPLAEQAITAAPDVTVNSLTNADDFIIIACDGVWDVLNNEAACQFVADELKQHHDDIGLVCEHVLDKCLAPAAPGIGCDNMTVIIVQPKADWKAMLPPPPAPAASA